ncbi:DUF4256 domain-containing protein [Denitromonas iodatirespirans]|uniref:DUF4256 domain-containing protein n=1 Tax=Denitromonas iodatirespirans TaxID=2795389 RepID=A0A944H9K1_DENI1|nr:DUF4256 domain-containing protein [Denitromonas iodatirespirans]MBT0959602.1 DUF4256 domain-containing protein [Denitromonas iodatirespirans]
MNAEQRKDLLGALKRRFEENMARHEGLTWDAVQARLAANAQKLAILHDMERTGGEPDVIACDRETGAFIFCDCSSESPSGRRSLCYDPEALEARKTNKPAGSAAGMASSMGVDILTEAQYRALQALGEFDRKTSSWVSTPADIRAQGGALFCDRRYGQVFVYHNGAESYYAARGFRARIEV